MAVHIQLRRDLAANWTGANPVLSEGEFAYELDTDKFKKGDGATDWNSLGYFSFPSAGPTTSYDEVPAGAINGINATFVLAHTPNPASTLELYWNGVLLRPGAGNDYTLAVATITMAQAPDTGDDLVAYYRY